MKHQLKCENKLVMGEGTNPWGRPRMYLQCIWMIGSYTNCFANYSSKQFFWFLSIFKNYLKTVSCTFCVHTIISYNYRILLNFTINVVTLVRKLQPIALHVMISFMASLYIYHTQREILTFFGGVGSNFLWNLRYTKENFTPPPPSSKNFPTEISPPLGGYRFPRNIVYPSPWDVSESIILPLQGPTRASIPRTLSLGVH